MVEYMKTVYTKHCACKDPRASVHKRMNRTVTTLPFKAGKSRAHVNQTRQLNLMDHENEPLFLFSYFYVCLKTMFYTMSICFCWLLRREQAVELCVIIHVAVLIPITVSCVLRSSLSNGQWYTSSLEAVPVFKPLSHSLNLWRWFSANGMLYYACSISLITGSYCRVRIYASHILIMSQNLNVFSSTVSFRSLGSSNE